MVSAIAGAVQDYPGASDAAGSFCTLNQRAQHEEQRDDLFL